MAKPRKIDILQNLDGVVHSGEMLVVLGPPGRYAAWTFAFFRGGWKGGERDMRTNASQWLLYIPQNHRR